MFKKSGILLAALILSTLTFASSASAQTAQAPATAVQAVQVAQPAAPLPDFLTAPAVETPAAPANLSTGLDWLQGTTNNICRCSKNSQCKTQGGVCCYWPHQNCGICCGA